MTVDREAYRQQQDLQRARIKIELQCQSMIRRVLITDDDRAGMDSAADAETREKAWKKLATKAAKAWGELRSGEDVADLPRERSAALRAQLAPYISAIDGINIAPPGKRAKYIGGLWPPESQVRTQLEKQAVEEPLWKAWGEGVRGLGPFSFAQLMCEAGRPLTDYRNPACLWKRFGLGVIERERQRKCADKEKAIRHGYAPQRRALMFVISENLLRANGPYKLIYDARKAELLAREGMTKIHAHRDALRYMVKRLLKDAWNAAGALQRAQAASGSDHATVDNQSPSVAPAPHPKRRRPEGGPSL